MATQQADGAGPVLPGGQSDPATSPQFAQTSAGAARPANPMPGLGTALLESTALDWLVNHEESERITTVHLAINPRG